MTECSRRPLGESLTRLLRDRGKALARTEFRRAGTSRSTFDYYSRIIPQFRQFFAEGHAFSLQEKATNRCTFSFLVVLVTLVGSLFSSHFVNNSTSRSRSARRFRFRSLFSASIRDESPPCPTFIRDAFPSIRSNRFLSSSTTRNLWGEKRKNIQLIQLMALFRFLRGS